MGFAHHLSFSMMREGYSCTLLDSFLACLQLPAIPSYSRASSHRYICCGINLPRRRIRTYSRRQNKYFKILQDLKLFRCAAETIRCEVSLRNSLRAVERVSAAQRRGGSVTLAIFPSVVCLNSCASRARARQVCESRTTTPSPSSPTPLHSISAFAALSLEMQKASVDGSINKYDA